MSDWLVVMEDEVEVAWELTSPNLNPMVLIPGLYKINLTVEGLLQSLTCALTVYLDSQSKWQELAQRGLQCLLTPLCAGMWAASKQPAVQQSQHGTIVQLQYFDTLASASEFCAAVLPSSFMLFACPDALLWPALAAQCT